MEESNKKYTYFASDFHLGAPTDAISLVREKEIVAWLNYIEPTAKEVFLVGDIFDFWFEYKHAIPKGFTRFLGKIADLTDKGIKVHFFCGNHDMWMFDYLEKEVGIELHRDDYQVQIGTKKFFIAHGDGLGPGDKGYKFIKKIFRNKFCQWAFARLHPNFGIALASYFSKTSRISNGEEDALYVGPEREWLHHFVSDNHAQLKADYYIFGHRHLPLKFQIQNALYFNLGEWINYQTFGRFDDTNFELLAWKDKTISPYKTISE
jgi:UDP-2,3-diacylglucosamine hydrolase